MPETLSFKKITYFAVNLLTMAGLLLTACDSAGATPVGPTRTPQFQVTSICFPPETPLNGRQDIRDISQLTSTTFSINGVEVIVNSPPDTTINQAALAYWYNLVYDPTLLGQIENITPEEVAAYNQSRQRQITPGTQIVITQENTDFVETCNPQATAYTFNAAQGSQAPDLSVILAERAINQADLARITITEVAQQVNNNAVLLGPMEKINNGIGVLAGTADALFQQGLAADQISDEQIIATYQQILATAPRVPLTTGGFAETARFNSQYVIKVIQNNFLVGTLFSIN